MRLKKDGTRFVVSLTVSPVKDDHGKIIGTSAIIRDISTEKLNQARQQQQLKLTAIGRLSAGVAHELNTPIQFVGDNVRFLKDGVNALLTLCETYKELLGAARAHKVTPDLILRCQTAFETSDIDFIIEEAPVALSQAMEGLERISRIVKSMRDFCPPEAMEKSRLDLNKAIQNTAVIGGNSWNRVADIQYDFDTSLPPVTCYAGELNQAILHLIVNAAHSIGEALKLRNEPRGTIKISTRKRGDKVQLRISDTGTGIPDEIRTCIFDPFFTTKSVGSGVGHGLTIVYSTIVNRLGGAINVESEIGKGTTFILDFPI